MLLQCSLTDKTKTDYILEVLMKFLRSWSCSINSKWSAYRLHAINDWIPSKYGYLLGEGCVSMLCSLGRTFPINHFLTPNGLPDFADPRSFGSIGELVVDAQGVQYALSDGGEIDNLDRLSQLNPELKLVDAFIDPVTLCVKLVFIRDCPSLRLAAAYALDEIMVKYDIDLPGKPVTYSPYIHTDPPLRAIEGAWEIADSVYSEFCVGVTVEGDVDICLQNDIESYRFASYSLPNGKKGAMWSDLKDTFFYCEGESKVLNICDVWG